MENIKIGTVWKNNRTGKMCTIIGIENGMVLYRLFPEVYGLRTYTSCTDSFIAEFTMVSEDVENIGDKSLLVEGTFWKNKKTGNVGYITDIQTRKGLVIFRYVPSGLISSFDNREFLRMFEILPSHPKSASESDVNNGVTDNSKLKDFGTGAKREDKTGKGRYDLIPGDVMNEFEDFAWATYFNNGVTTCSATDVSKSAYFDEWDNVELYYDFIVNVICYFFAKDRLVCLDDCSEISYEINWSCFRSGLYEMRKQLALHYESGALVHGVDNWKKGIPVYGSERGGCFLDSMRRHIDQALQGKEDEPHAISAIWNAFGAVWTLNNHPKTSSDIKINNRDDRLEIIFPNNKKINIDIPKVELSDDKSEIVGIVKPKDEKSDD